MRRTLRLLARAEGASQGEAEQRVLMFAELQQRV
jgi:hypothetical protein